MFTGSVGYNARVKVYVLDNTLCRGIRRCLKAGLIMTGMGIGEMLLIFEERYDFKARSKLVVSGRLRSSWP